MSTLPLDIRRQAKELIETGKTSAEVLATAKLCGIYRLRSAKPRQDYAAKLEVGGNLEFVPSLPLETLPLIAKLTGKRLPKATITEILKAIVKPGSTQPEPLELSDAFPVGETHGTHIFKVMLVQFPNSDFWTPGLTQIDDPENYRSMMRNLVSPESLEPEEITNATIAGYFAEVDDEHIDGLRERVYGTGPQLLGAIKLIRFIQQTQSGKYWARELAGDDFRRIQEIGESKMWKLESPEGDQQDKEVVD